MPKFCKCERCGEKQKLVFTGAYIECGHCEHCTAYSLPVPPPQKWTNDLSLSERMKLKLSDNNLVKETKLQLGRKGLFLVDTPLLHAQRSRLITQFRRTYLHSLKTRMEKQLNA